jgi:hypothetical protein
MIELNVAQISYNYTFVMLCLNLEINIISAIVVHREFIL